MNLRTSRVFLTIFGQCINVLNYNMDYFNKIIWIILIIHYKSCRESVTSFKMAAKTSALLDFTQNSN